MLYWSVGLCFFLIDVFVVFWNGGGLVFWYSHKVRPRWFLHHGKKGTEFFRGFSTKKWIKNQRYMQTQIHTKTKNHIHTFVHTHTHNTNSYKAETQSFRHTKKHIHPGQQPYSFFLKPPLTINTNKNISTHTNTYTNINIHTYIYIYIFTPTFTHKYRHKYT